MFIHPYRKESDEQSKMEEQVQFSDDLGLAGERWRYSWLRGARAWSWA
jgi:hypothetical protein